MSLLQAIVYFLREAIVNLSRSWRISLLAIGTIGVSVFLSGFFLLVSVNGSRVVEEWKREAKVVVYLAPGVEPEQAPEARALAESPGWVEGVTAVSSREAKERFRRSFPSVEDLVEGWEQDPLPASLEIAFDLESADSEGFQGWVDQLAAEPRVIGVDDDRDWVRQLETALRVVTGIGLTLGVVLLGAAVFTIASVIRLTAYLYREEIAVMRLVGATEFFIRGPFYLEGLLQGAVGGAVALAALYAAYGALTPEGSSGLLGGILWSRFLSWPLQAGVVVLGSVAGLLGAILSLRREAV